MGKYRVWLGVDLGPHHCCRGGDRSGAHPSWPWTCEEGSQLTLQVQPTKAIPNVTERELEAARPSFRGESMALGFLKQWCSNWGNAPAAGAAFPASAIPNRRSASSEAQPSSNFGPSAPALNGSCLLKIRFCRSTWPNSPGYRPRPRRWVDRSGYPGAH